MSLINSFSAVCRVTIEPEIKQYEQDSVVNIPLAIVNTPTKKGANTVVYINGSMRNADNLVPYLKIGRMVSVSGSIKDVTEKNGNKRLYVDISSLHFLDSIAEQQKPKEVKQLELKTVRSPINPIALPSLTQVEPFAYSDFQQH